MTTFLYFALGMVTAWIPPLLIFWVIIRRAKKLPVVDHNERIIRDGSNDNSCHV